MAQRPANVIPAHFPVIPTEAGIQEGCRGRVGNDGEASGDDGFRTSVAARTERADSVAVALRRATARLREAGMGTPKLDAEVLLMNSLGWSREDLYRNPEGALQEVQAQRFESLVSRRLQAEPVAYVTGSREFWSLDFRVTPDVLIPRPETEHLVEAVLDFLAARPGPCRVLEIGTGSGAVAVSVARECARAEVWATDVSGPALEIARENADRHGLGERINWRRGDLFAPVQGLPAWFDVVMSNPPYVPSGDIARLQRDVRDWEPALALDGGVDGMDFCRRLVRGGVRHVRAGGMLAVEVGAEQGDEVSRLFQSREKLHRIRVRRDHAGLPRVVIGERMPGH